MKQCVRVVVAVGACGFLGVGGVAWAQTGGGTQAPDRPYLYLWGSPPPGTQWYDLLPQASQMVRVQTNVKPPTGYPYSQERYVAEQVILAMNAQFDETSDSTRFCVVLQNFGMYAPTPDSLFPSPQYNFNYNAYNSFLHELDKPNPEPDWDENPQYPTNQPNVPNNPEQRYYQPWNVNGRAKAKAWMQIFLNEFEALRIDQNNDPNPQTPILPVPTRFHFDTEIGFGGCCETNYTRIVEAWTQDARWGTGPYDPNDPTSYPVPGSADYLVSSAGVPKTMYQMYDEAKTVFGWPNKPLFHPLLTSA